MEIIKSQKALLLKWFKKIKNPEDIRYLLNQIMWMSKVKSVIKWNLEQYNKKIK